MSLARHQYSRERAIASDISQAVENTEEFKWRHGL
jgi:hypothetical protein